MFRSLIASLLTLTLTSGHFALAQTSAPSRISSDVVKQKSIQVVQELYDIATLKENIAKTQETLGLLKGYEGDLSSKITRSQIGVAISTVVTVALVMVGNRKQDIRTIAYWAVAALVGGGFGGSFGADWIKHWRRRQLTNERIDELNAGLAAYKVELETDEAILKASLEKLVEMGQALGLNVRNEVQTAIQSEQFQITLIEETARQLSRTNFSSEIEAFKRKDAQGAFFWIAFFAMDDIDRAIENPSAWNIADVIIDLIAMGMKVNKAQKAQRTIEDNQRLAKELEIKVAKAKEAYRKGLAFKLDQIFAR